MSSTYRVLCLSHDPAMVVDRDYRRPEEAEAAIAAGIAEHPRCDLAIGRYSYPLVEVGCPASRSQPAKLTCHHGGTIWADREWLRLLAAGYATADQAVHDAVRQGRFSCWPQERLQRLAAELDLPAQGEDGEGHPAGDTEPAVPAAAFKLLRFMVNRCAERGINNADYILALVDHAIDEHTVREYVDGLERDELELRARVEIAEASSRELASIVARLRGAGIIDEQGKPAPYTAGVVEAAALDRVRALHHPVPYRGRTICAECSNWAGGSTDSPPVDHDQCGTLRALNQDKEQP